MARICMLLNGDIKNDARVIKTIHSLRKQHCVDLYYITITNEHHSFFIQNVKLFGIKPPKGFCTKLIRHTFFYNEFLFFVKKVLQNQVQYDYIYANDLPCLKPAVIISKKLNAKVIYDAHEIYTETINQFFPNRPNFLKKIIFSVIINIMKMMGKHTEKKLLKKVDQMITVGEGLKNYFENTYHFKNIKVVMNCPSKKEIKEAVNFSEILNLPKNAFILLYQGILNEGRGLRILVDSMLHTLPNVYLVIIGEGMLENTLKKMVQEKNITNKVFFIGTVSLDVLPQYTKGAHCGINLIEPINLSKSLAAPNKLFQYIHAEIPVIASYSYESVKLFNNYKIGYLTNNDPHSVAEAINKMSLIDRKTFIENCKKAKDEYNWENQENVLLSLFD